MSNRQERRAAARGRGNPHTVHVPDGKLIRAEVLTRTGEVAEVTNWRQLPAKVPGVHRWQVAMAHYMTPEQAAAWDGRSPSSPVLLDASSVMFAGLGCTDCEQEYRDAVGRPCPAGDEWVNHG